jgi:putative ABC transport system permease protein
MNKMIVSNLLHRPVRSLISVVAIAVEVTLILLMVGLATGLLNDSRMRQQGLGADVIVLPPGASFLTGLSGAPVSIKVAGVIRRLPHVAAVAPIIFQTNTAGTVEVIYGIDLASFEALGGPFHYLAGGPFTGPDSIIVDDYFARSKHVHVGDTLPLLNHTFRVSGIVEQGRGARKFLPIETLQDLIGAQGKASVFYAKLDNPANAGLVVEEIKNIPGMQTYSVRSMSDFLSMYTVGNMPGLSSFISVVVGVAMVIGFIVIFQAMYTAVMERTREIGILKSLGASRLYIVNVILRETLVLALAGIAAGVALSYTARAGIVGAIPTLRVIVPPVWIIYATVIAIIGAMLGAIYPAVKAARKDPIDALAYE